MPTIRRPQRVAKTNRDAERDGPDPAHAEQFCPTKVRIQLGLYDFTTRGYFAWRGASFNVVAADRDEALSLFFTLKKAAHEWWAAQEKKHEDPV